MSCTVKAMSFNLLVGWDHGGENSFLNRRERILKVILSLFFARILGYMFYPNSAYPFIFKKQKQEVF